MIPPTLFSISGICFVWFTNLPHWSKPALSYLIMLIMTIMTMTMMTLRGRQVWLPQRQIAVFALAVQCRQGTKPQKSYSAMLQYTSIVLYSNVCTKPQKSAATLNRDTDCEDNDYHTYEIYVLTHNCIYNYFLNSGLSALFLFQNTLHSKPSTLKGESRI